MNCLKMRNFRLVVLFLSSSFVSNIGVELHANAENSASQKSLSSTSRANRYLDDTNNQIQLRQDSNPYLNSTAPIPLKKIPNKKPLEPSSETYGVPMVDGPAKISPDPGRSKTVQERPTLPNEVVERGVINARQFKLLTEEERRNREAYVRQFQENAAKDGVTVIIDENLNIISATRRSPSSSKPNVRSIQSIEDSSGTKSGSGSGAR